MRFSKLASMHLQALSKQAGEIWFFGLLDFLTVAFGFLENFVKRIIRLAQKSTVKSADACAGGASAVRERHRIVQLTAQ